MRGAYIYLNNRIQYSTFIQISSLFAPKHCMKKILPLSDISLISGPKNVSVVSSGQKPQPCLRCINSFYYDTCVKLQSKISGNKIHMGWSRVFFYLRKKNYKPSEGNIKLTYFPLKLPYFKCSRKMKQL